jgi:pSer/pThr/pTyr-binding forkhead associated (FHA) protein
MPTKRKGSPSSVSNGKAWGELQRMGTSTWSDGPDTFYLEERSCKIGRVQTTGIDIVIDLAVISSKHCTLEPGDKIAGGQMTCILSDHSTNGTFVDGERVGRGNRFIVTEGMSISFGKLNAGSKKKKWEIPQYKLVLHDGHNPHKKQRSNRSSPGRARTDMSAKLQRNNDKLREELTTEQDKCSKLKKNVQELQEALRETGGNDVASLGKENATQASEIERLKDDLKKMEGLAESHKSEADRQAIRATTAEKEKEQVEKQLSERQKEHGMAATEAEHLQTKTKDMEKLLAAHTVELEAAQSKANALKLKVTELTNVRDEQEKKMTTHLEEIQRLTDSEKTASNMLQEHKKHVEEINKTLQEERDSKSALQLQYDAISSQFNDLTKLQASTIHELDEKKQNLINTGKAMNKMVAASKDKDTKIEEMERELEDMRLRLVRAQRKNNSLSEREEIQRQRAANTRRQIEESLPGIQTLLSHLKNAAAKPSDADDGSQSELSMVSPGASMRSGPGETQPDDEEEEEAEDDAADDVDETLFTKRSSTTDILLRKGNKSKSNTRFPKATQHQGTDEEEDEEDGDAKMKESDGGSSGEKDDDDPSQTQMGQDQYAGEGEESQSLIDDME